MGLLVCLFALLTYFEVGPGELVNALSGMNFALYILIGMLIGWGTCRMFHGLCFKGKRKSKREALEAEEQFNMRDEIRGYFNSNSQLLAYV